MTSDPNNSPRKVEKRLFRVCKRVREAEVRTGLFRRMKRQGIATSDVRNFVRKQAELKRVNKHVHVPTIKQAMKDKLSDTYASLVELRKSKKEIKEDLNHRFLYPKSKCRKLVKSYMRDTADHKNRQYKKSNDKFDHCKEKMNEFTKDTRLLLSPDICKIIDGVNIFNKDLEPEKSADPMICDKTIKLSKCELAFLRKGPRFMMREAINENDFCTEIGKMIVKEKYDQADRVDPDNDESVVSGDIDSIDQKLTAEAALTYDKESGVIDMGKFRATNYKFNKMVFLPESESIEREAKHEIRKAEMLRVFKKVCSESGTTSSYNKNKNKKSSHRISEPSHGKPSIAGTLDSCTIKEPSHGRPCIAGPESGTSAGAHMNNRDSHGRPCIADSESGANTGANMNNRNSHGRPSIADPSQSGGNARSSLSSNLSRSEAAGLKSLKKRVENNELIITETDKSKRFCVLKRDQYYESGAKHTKDDIELSWDQVHSIQKVVNDHCKWLRKIFGVGLNWGHEDRFNSNMVDRGEIVAPLYLLIKDHKGWLVDSKTPPPSRPVCSGNQGFNRHLSEILSMVLEPLCHSIPGNDIDSTAGLLEKVEALNKDLKFETQTIDNMESDDFTSNVVHDAKIKKNSSFGFCSKMRKMRVDNLRSLKSNKSPLPNFRAKLWAMRLMNEESSGKAISLPVSDDSNVQSHGGPSIAGPGGVGCSHMTDSQGEAHGRPSIAEPSSLPHGGPSIAGTTEAQMTNSTDGSADTIIPPIQKEGSGNLIIAGADVEALFPSLSDLESARIAGEAVVESKASFENIDYTTALKYLLIVGGASHLRENKLTKYAPKWLGSRPDLLTVGGEALEETGKWYCPKVQMNEMIKKKIISMVIETAVIVCMGTHVYSFGEKIFLQKRGGPIGMRFTASLANLVMKKWDQSFTRLLKREGITYKMYVRYVDDCRVVLPAINKGWKWDGSRFVFTNNVVEEIPDSRYTTNEITKAMCSLVSFLKFTGEEESMFPSRKLPTLDTELWLENGQIMFSYFEKPTVGNKVLCCDTALPVSSIRASLLQEVVRRLLNCSECLPVDEKQRILSKLAQKLINSGHSTRSTKILIVQGVAKYLYKLKVSRLNSEDSRYRPLYLSKEYEEKDRQVKKHQAKLDWFKGKKRDDSDYRHDEWKYELPKEWRGDNMSQRCAPGMEFTTMMKIPNTKGAKLYRSLVTEENRLASITGYNVKIVESSGIQLVRLFSRVQRRSKCHWEHCAVCKESGDKPSKCRTRNLVYQGICLVCENEIKEGLRDPKKAGVYIGETSRSMAERALEHVKGAKNLDKESFITKHWVLEHKELDAPPQN